MANTNNYQHQKTSVWKGDETTWGTPVTVDTLIGTVTNVNPSPRWTKLDIRGVGDGREVSSFVKTQFTVGASLSYQMHDFLFLKHAVGPLSGDGDDESPYIITEADHTGITAATNIIPFTLEVGSDSTVDDVDKYTGCFINDFTLNFSLGGVAECTANIVAKSMTSGTSLQAYTAPTTQPLVMSEGTFKYDATPTAVAGIRSATVSYNNNLIIMGEWNTLFIVQPETGPRVISWSVTCVMTNTVAAAMRDDFYGQANTPVTDSAVFAADMELEIALDEGAVAGDRRSYIRLDQCIIESMNKPINIGNNDLVLITFNGRAKTSKTNKFAEWETVN